MVVTDETVIDMARQQRQCTMVNPYRLKRSRALLPLLLLLVCCVLAGCQTVTQGNGMLERLQDSATPTPPDRLSPPREQVRAKAAMTQWIEQYLKQEYRIIDQRFVLTEPGFTAGALIGSKANRYVKQELGGVPQPDTWFQEDGYLLLRWKLGEDSPRYIAFLMTSDFLPDTRERSLVGYFELAPSTKR